MQRFSTGVQNLPEIFFGCPPEIFLNPEIFGKIPGRSGWYTSHSSSAMRAILLRAGLVDLTVEVRDAKIPSASAFQPTANNDFIRKRIVLLNKADLADSMQTEIWLSSLRERKCFCFGVNAHNEENIKQFIIFLKSLVKDLKGGNSTDTATVMLVGVPNVGKSAIANALHKLGRLSAQDKGKLRRAMVTANPGETKDIRSYKIASHPSIYVLDTLGMLCPEIPDACTESNLALTGVIDDRLIGECTLARHLLSLLNSKEEYKKWEFTSKSAINNCAQKRRQYPSDHTQDFIVHSVRRRLFNTISSYYSGCPKDACDMARLIDFQFAALHEDFRVPKKAPESYGIVALKLLNLYRTGRLGRYTLEPINSQTI